MIVERGNAGLVTPCDFSVRSVKEYKKVRKKLLKAFNACPQAVAIASNQVLANEYGEAPAAFLFEGKLYINPTYEEPKLFQVSLYIGSVERCLSDITNQHTVKRWNLIQVEYLLLDRCSLYPKRQLLCGQEAVVFQHETDHLRGVTLWTKQNQ